jgi:hypothetical protein
VCNHPGALNAGADELRFAATEAAPHVYERWSGASHATAALEAALALALAAAALSFESELGTEAEAAAV